MKWCFNTNLICLMCVLVAHKCKLLPPREREGMLADRGRAGRYVCRSYSDSLCIELDNDRLFHSSLTLVFENLDLVTSDTFRVAEPHTDVNDDSFIEYFVSKPEPLVDHLSEDEFAQLKAHAARCDAENHAIVSVLKAKHSV